MRILRCTNKRPIPVFRRDVHFAGADAAPFGALEDLPQRRVDVTHLLSTNCTTFGEAPPFIAAAQDRNW